MRYDDLAAKNTVRKHGQTLSQKRQPVKASAFLCFDASIIAPAFQSPSNASAFDRNKKAPDHLVGCFCFGHALSRVYHGYFANRPLFCIDAIP